jgi:predicted acylesterase/phospholipase RssA
LLDNLPLDVMAEHCRGPIIAVDVYPYNRPKNEGKGRSHKRLVDRLAEFKPFSHKGPWLFDVLVHATLVGSQHMTAMSLSSHPPALHLVPDLAKFRVLDWRAYEALFQAGYVSAKHELEAGRLPRSLWEGRLEDTAS